MWTTESKIGVVILLLIVSAGILGSSRSEHNTKTEAINTLMETGEVDCHEDILFFTSQSEEMDAKTLDALAFLSKGFRTVKVYNAISNYKDHELWLMNKPEWDTVYNTPMERYLREVATMDNIKRKMDE
jgi:hypothetical protein